MNKSTVFVNVSGIGNFAENIQRLIEKFNDKSFDIDVRQRKLNICSAFQPKEEEIDMMYKEAISNQGYFSINIDFKYEDDLDIDERCALFDEICKNDIFADIETNGYCVVL